MSALFFVKVSCCWTVDCQRKMKRRVWLLQVYVQLLFKGVREQ